MVTVIPNGGGDDDPTNDDADSYHQSINKPPGDRTPEEQQVIDEFEATLETIGNAREDSGGPGGWQAAVALEVGRFVADMEHRRKDAIVQWAPKAASGGVGARRAQMEMHAADTVSIVELAWLLFELKERLNDSPY